MNPALSSELRLAKLRQPRPYPAVSLVMPTHRREPDNAQDPVRLRNLVAAAEKAVQDDPAVTRERRADVLDQLRRAVAEVDLAHAEDGLVIFVAPGEHHVWSVARSVPERVVLADTFLTRNLVAAQAAEQPSWALAVAADRVSLWSGSPETLTEHTKRHPAHPQPRGPGTRPRKERVGDLPGTFQGRATRQFLREAHTALRAVLASEPRPLYVIGEPVALALLEETGPLPQDTTPVHRGGLANGPAAAVHEAVEPARAAREAAGSTTVVAELGAARGRREFAGGLDEVWQAVKEGRIRLLAVEDHYRTVVRDEGGHLEPAEPSEAGARDDMVDERRVSCDTGNDDPGGPAFSERPAPDTAGFSGEPPSSVASSASEVSPRASTSWRRRRRPRARPRARRPWGGDRALPAGGRERSEGRADGQRAGRGRHDRQAQGGHRRRADRRGDHHQQDVEGGLLRRTGRLPRPFRARSSRRSSSVTRTSNQVDANSRWSSAGSLLSPCSPQRLTKAQRY
ncbi:hypothetical protein STANM309S_06090 [Streptomyces tanashiensis]